MALTDEERKRLRKNTLRLAEFSQRISYMPDKKGDGSVEEKVFFIDVVADGTKNGPGQLKEGKKYRVLKKEFIYDKESPHTKVRIELVEEQD
ncbi:MAG: hypothetical protein WDZ40_03800 [Candidatus Spechtbacterales bacterium]